MYYFNYSDNSCTFKNDTCEVDVVKESWGKNDYAFRVKCKKRFAEFGFYNHSLGLVKLSTNNPKMTDNILLKFISIDTENEKKGIKQLYDFFSNYGFLFKIPDDKYEKIKFNDVKNLVNRLTAMVKLFNELQTTNTNYEMIIVYMMKLILSEPFTINTRYSTYRSYTHEIRSVLDNNRGSKSYGSWGAEENSEPDRVDSDPYAPIQYDDQDEDDLTPGIYEQLGVLVRRDKGFNDPFFYEINGETDSKRSGVDDDLLKRISDAYNKENGYSYRTYVLLDFLYYYYENVGIIKEFSDNGLIFYDDDQVHRENFNDDDKNTLVLCAREILTNEINYNLRGVKVVYNPYLRVNEIHMETLLEGLYYSLSFSNPDLVIYKRCPTCLNYFEVSSTNSRKKFCSPECQNNRKDKRKIK